LWRRAAFNIGLVFLLSSLSSLNVQEVATDSLQTTVLGYSQMVHELTIASEASDFPWHDWTHYHGYSEIVDTLFHLNSTRPSLVDVFSIGKSALGREIYCLRLTSENVTCRKTEILFVGYHHARECISAELPLYFAVYALENYGIDAALTWMLDLSEIYIVVALNVDALDVVVANEWQRKNLNSFDEDGDGLFDEDPPDDADGDGFVEHLVFWNGVRYVSVRWEGVDADGDGMLNEDWVGGVDLNRNYGYMWNATVQSGSPYMSEEDYRGPAPFSEPETRALKDLALQHDFEYAVSFHSGAQAILYPWGHTTVAAPDSDKLEGFAEELSQLIGCWYRQSGSWYTTSGCWDDWMYGTRGTCAFTVEMYSNSSAWHYEPGPDQNTLWESGAFDFYNPKPYRIESTILRWMPTFFYTINRAIFERAEDLNLDGKIDILDLAIAARAFGSHPGNPRWSPLADLNHDEKVDLQDIIRFARRFGELL